MDVKILYLKDKGDIKNERIVILALEDCNIGDYILFDTTYQDDQISNLLRHPFWFPDKKIMSGEKIEDFAYIKIHT